jgi:hypothetical protein
VKVEEAEGPFDLFSILSVFANPIKASYFVKLAHDVEVDEGGNRKVYVAGRNDPLLRKQKVLLNGELVLDGHLSTPKYRIAVSENEENIHQIHSYK